MPASMPVPTLAIGCAFIAIGAAALGHLADATSIRTVYQVCAFLPAIGLLTWFLPDVHENKITKK